MYNINTLTHFAGKPNNMAFYQLYLQLLLLFKTRSAAAKDNCRWDLPRFRFEIGEIPMAWDQFWF
jgi:hypothetical protein